MSTTALAEAGEPAAGRRRARHPTRWVAGALVAALVAVAIVAATRPSARASQVASPLVGHPAPALSGTTLTGGRFSLASERGRYVYVNFFASWCPPCQQEEPSLIKFAYQQSRSTSGAAMVSVVFNDTVASSRRFVEQWGAGWPAVEDSGGTIANRFGVESPPTTFLVDPGGVVVGVWEGPVTTSELDGMLAAARGLEPGGGGG